jgi:hypothetical protein
MLTSEEILEKGEYGTYKDTPGEHYFHICAMCGRLRHAHSGSGGNVPVGRIVIKNDYRSTGDVPFVLKRHHE